MKRNTEWIRCPVYGNKTRDRIREDTVLKNYPLYCPKCKQETLIKVKSLTEYISPITVEVAEPLRFFFCRFLSECAAGLFPLLAVVRHLSNLD